MSPTVSVIVPCYKQAHFLAEAIEGALAQTYTPVEVVVIDDGSPDDVPGVTSRYPGVRLVRQENAGLAAARNAGVRASTGSHLVFLDADDRLPPDAIALSMRALDEHPGAVLAFGATRRFADDGSPVSSLPPTIEGEPYEALLRRNVIGCPASALIRRDAFESVGGFDGSPGLSGAEDYDLYLKLASRWPIASHDGLVAEARRHSAGMHLDFGRMLMSTVNVMRRQRSNVQGNRRLTDAYAHGMRSWRETYGTRLARQALADVRSVRRFPAAARAAVMLLRFDRGIVLRGMRKAVSQSA